MMDSTGLQKVNYNYWLVQLVDKSKTFW